MGALLAAQADDEVNAPVALGMAHRLPARLLARRVPPAVAEVRRRRLRAEAKRRGDALSQERLALADWLVFVTNAPAAQMSLAEALALARARWQIALLFKRWKSDGGLGDSRSANPWRVPCELYATLIALVLQHWSVLLGCWEFPERSLAKAAAVVRRRRLAGRGPAQPPPPAAAALATLGACLAVGCRIPPRRANPPTFQLLLAFPEVLDAA